MGHPVTAETGEGTAPAAVEIGGAMAIVDGQNETGGQGRRGITDPFGGFQVDLGAKTLGESYVELVEIIE
jgi:hypothetical protein